MASELSGIRLDVLWILFQTNRGEYTAPEIRGEIERRLSSRPEVPGDVLESANRILKGPHQRDDRWNVAEFVLSLSPATPEVK